jgi:phosphoserine/homoserine phosphotransferase
MKIIIRRRAVTAMKKKPTIIAMDLEGVLVPEIWIAVSEKTGIEKLRLTTRDVADYDELMQMRLAILKENNLTLGHIQEVIKTVDPLEGALDFLDWVRSRVQAVILSDTYYEFALPLMKKLGYPSLFCNNLETDENNTIIDYHLRIRDGKKKATRALKELGFRVISMGDSYNDTTMLGEADEGILFRPPDNVVAEFPQYRVFYKYEALKNHLTELLQV